MTHVELNCRTYVDLYRTEFEMEQLDHLTVCKQMIDV